MGEPVWSADLILISDTERLWRAAISKHTTQNRLGSLEARERHRSKTLSLFVLIASLIISLGLLVPPVAGAALRFITTHDLCLAVATLKKWFVAAILFFSIAAMALSIMTNEVRNCEFLFHPENRKHESFELSRDLGQTVKANATIIGSEMALRFLGFENRCKFLFNHDGGNSRGLDPRDLDNSDIARRKDIRYFCIALPTNSILLDQYLFGISKIKRLCPAMTLLKIYRFGDTVLSLFDKYPGLGAEKRF